MNFEYTNVFGIEHAIRGMRNPKNSHKYSDSYWDFSEHHERFIIGPKDLKLMKTLIKGGPEHRKFMRQIFVSVDITAPLYWWKEFDTYKVGTTANSTSTMHKLSETEINIDCFEIDDYDPTLRLIDDIPLCVRIDNFLDDLEQLRQKYLMTNDKRYWKELIRWLPEGWQQTRTVTMTYENIYNIIHQRQYHKLNEWSGKDNNNLSNFIGWTKVLPYADELFCYDDSVFNNKILLICGESGSGKSTVADKLAEKYNLKVLQSYTTRPKRTENETGHTFITEEEFNDLKDMVAYTMFDGYRYCATSEQVDENDIYVIDPDGIKYFRKNYTGNKQIIVVYIRAPFDERIDRMNKRGDSEDQIRLRLHNDEFKFANVLDVCDIMVQNKENKINSCISDIYNYIKSKE